MEYIPGQIHPNFQRECFILLNYDFCWMNCRLKRWSEMSDSRDWDNCESLELRRGDVIVVRFFKSSPTSAAYTYLERVIYVGGSVIEYKTESIVSLDLIQRNWDLSALKHRDRCLFTDVTNQFIRDKKLQMLLEV
jgi:hypothetical protein